MGHCNDMNCLLNLSGWTEWKSDEKITTNKIKFFFYLNWFSFEYMRSLLIILGFHDYVGHILRELEETLVTFDE